MFSCQELGREIIKASQTGFKSTFEELKSKSSLNVRRANHSKVLEHHIRNNC